MDDCKIQSLSVDRTDDKMSGGATPAEPTLERMKGVSAQGMHGRCAAPHWNAPLLTRACDMLARPDASERSMLAHEYTDDAETLAAKVDVLAELLMKAQHCTIYSGAGISTSAGINDYASKAADSASREAPRARSNLDACPTFTHRALVALVRAGHIADWIQQNHDGLPQKAGCPQHVLNEIHGAWFDPSNPVVSMKGSLRDDLYARFEATCEKTDLVLALGTSLAATMADSIVERVSERAVERTSKKKPKGSRKCLGAVIITLQRTSFDDRSALRIFAKMDDVFALLAARMKLDVEKPTVAYTPTLPPGALTREPDVFLVPYQKDGEQVQDEDGTSKELALTRWDLRQGAKVCIMSGPAAGSKGIVLEKSPAGDYRIQFPRIVANGDEWLLKRDEAKGMADARGNRVYLMGRWWVESAAKGLCDRLPFVSE